MISFYLSQYPQENEVIRALYDGCDETKELRELSDYSPSDVAVVMGIYKKNVPASFPRGRVIEKQKSAGLDVLVLETGYINRGAGAGNHYALGWNGLNGRADFKNKNSPPDRAAKVGRALQERRYGKRVLLCGQVPWDASVDFTHHQSWLIQTAENIMAVSGMEVVFRPHPKALLPNVPGCRYSVGRPIEEDLEDCHALVSFNSNSGVDAVMAGVPVFAFDEGSMVWPLANRHLIDIENPELPDRTQWLNDICYAQWTPAEMRSGEAWSHLRK